MCPSFKQRPNLVHIRPCQLVPLDDGGNSDVLYLRFALRAGIPCVAQL